MLIITLIFLYLFSFMLRAYHFNFMNACLYKETPFTRFGCISHFFLSDFSTFTW